jgi:hypothetical protein
MESALQTILESLPEKPPRSKLEPHRELIRELRRKGRTYREVARLFHERLGLYVAPSTLHSFVKVRAKHHNEHNLSCRRSNSLRRRRRHSIALLHSGKRLSWRNPNLPDLSFARTNL